MIDSDDQRSVTEQLVFVNKKLESLANFFKAAIECEKTIGLGIYICFDSVLYYVTTLLLRLIITPLMLIFNYVKKITTQLMNLFCFRRKRGNDDQTLLSRPIFLIHQSIRSDILRFSIFASCVAILIPLVEISSIYHWIKQQATIKSLFLYNLFDVVDKMIGAFNIDPFESVEQMIYLPFHILFPKLAKLFGMNKNEDEIDDENENEYLDENGIQGEDQNDHQIEQSSDERDQYELPNLQNFKNEFQDSIVIDELQVIKEEEDEKVQTKPQLIIKQLELNHSQSDTTLITPKQLQQRNQYVKPHQWNKGNSFYQPNNSLTTFQESQQPLTLQSPNLSIFGFPRLVPMTSQPNNQNKRLSPLRRTSLYQTKLYKTPDQNSNIGSNETKFNEQLKSITPESKKIKSNQNQSKCFSQSPSASVRTLIHPNNSSSSNSLISNTSFHSQTTTLQSQVSSDTTDLKPQFLIFGDFTFPLVFLLVIIGSLIHCLAFLFHLISLFVIFNSNSSGLVSLIVSSQFSELKSNIFKKSNKAQLFKIVSQDAVSRFNLISQIILIVIAGIAENISYEDNSFGFINNQIKTNITASYFDKTLQFINKIKASKPSNVTVHNLSQYLQLSTISLINTTNILIQQAWNNFTSNPLLYSKEIISSIIIYGSKSLHQISHKVYSLKQKLHSLIPWSLILTPLIRYSAVFYVTQCSVDWLKHAFLIKFNETEGIGAEIYGHLREQIVHLCKKLSKGETFDNTGSLAKMLSFHPLPVAASTIIFLTNCIHLPKFSGFQYIPLWFVVWIGIFTIKVFGSLQFMHYVKNRVNSSEAQ